MVSWFLFVAYKDYVVHFDTGLLDFPFVAFVEVVQIFFSPPDPELLGEMLHSPVTQLSVLEKIRGVKSSLIMSLSSRMVMSMAGVSGAGSFGSFETVHNGVWFTIAEASASIVVNSSYSKPLLPIC